MAALFYTLMECAKLADVNPKEYLLAVAEAASRMPKAVLLPAVFKATLQLAST